MVQDDWAYTARLNQDEEDCGGCSDGCSDGCCAGCCVRFWECLKKLLFYILCCCCNCCGCPCCCWRGSGNSENHGNGWNSGNGSGRYGGGYDRSERSLTGYNQPAHSEYQGRHVGKPPKKESKPSSSTKTKINIKAGKGVTIIAGDKTLKNAQIDVQSGTGQNNIVALGQNGNYTVTTADGRLQKAAGGEYVHTPGTALTGGSTDRPELTHL